MEATVTKPFLGAPDGEVYPRKWKAGDTVSGRLAAVALAQGWAVTGDVADVPTKKRRALRGRKS